MPVTMRFQVHGVQELVDQIREIGGRRGMNAMRRATSRAGTILLQTIRPITPIRTGLLKKSMGKKDSKHTQKNIYSVIGPRRGFRQVVATRAAKSRVKRAQRNGRIAPDNKGRIQNPVKYAHLVDLGHRGPNGKGFVRGRPFMLAGRLIAKQQIEQAVKLVLEQELLRGNASANPIV